MNSRLTLTLLVFCLACSSCTSQKKEEERAEATAKAATTIGIIATLKTAEVVYEFGRVKPHVASWNNGKIEVVGIKPTQVGDFYIWSATSSRMLWALQSKQDLREDYSKKSKHERIQINYGIPPKEWDQKKPINSPPENITLGLYYIYFGYSFDFFFSRSGSYEGCYVKITDKETDILYNSEISDTSWITLKEHEKYMERFQNAWDELRGIKPIKDRESEHQPAL